jgi:transposase-like protein
VIVFPHICPSCSSARTRQVVPESPEVDTFRCDDCAHEWSVPAAPPLRPIPDRALPHDWMPKKE